MRLLMTLLQKFVLKEGGSAGSNRIDFEVIDLNNVAKKKEISSKNEK